jgi:hypothetical protein
MLRVHSLNMNDDSGLRTYPHKLSCIMCMQGFYFIFFCQDLVKMQVINMQIRQDYRLVDSHYVSFCSRILLTWECS